MDLSSLGTIITLATIVVPIVILVVVGIVVAVVLGRRGNNGAPSLFGQMEKAMNAGTASPQQIEVERSGRIARARILDVNELESVARNRTMVYHRCSLVLEVMLPGVAPYRVQTEQWFISSAWYSISANTMVPVRIDQTNPQIVFVDLAAREQEKHSAENAERDAHARRQAELLGRR